METKSLKEDILDLMRKVAKPVSLTEIEKLSGIERKDLEKAFQELKKEKQIVSPVRCKWESKKEEKE